VFADGAYDGEPIYRSIAGHTPDAGGFTEIMSNFI
jgi:hypothetical protein